MTNIDSIVEGFDGVISARPRNPGAGGTWIIWFPTVSAANSASPEIAKLDHIELVKEFMADTLVAEEKS